jgi:hypothetical protein
MTQKSLPDTKSLPFGGAGAIMDPEQLAALGQITLDLPRLLWDDQVIPKFLTQYVNWISAGRSNIVNGLDQFPYAVYTNATTEAFDKFYIKNHCRRFRCFRGEYMYHILTWRNSFGGVVYLDDEPLAAGDAVVISFPFADTGNQHAGTNTILKQATELGVPVLLDMAYFGTCSGLTFDLTAPCITDVTFSLSKSMPMSTARVGMRLTRTDDDDPLFVINKTDYCNKVGASIASAMLDQFTADYIPCKYRNLQHEWSEQLNIEPSACVMFGSGDQSWAQYDRGTGKPRLSLHKYLGAGKLPNE